MADRGAATLSDVTIFRKFDQSNIVSKRHKTTKFDVIAFKLRTTSRQNMSFCQYKFCMVLITFDLLFLVSKYNNPLK